MFIIGFDISGSSMGVCSGPVGSVPTFETHVLLRDGETRSETCGRLMGWWAERSQAIKAVHGDDSIAVYVEAPLPGGPKFHRNPQVAYLLGGLACVVGAISFLREFKHREVSVQTVRAHFIGHGNMPGDDAKKAAKRRCHQLGWEPKNYDESDAGAVWHYGCAQQRPKAIQEQLKLRR